MDAVFVPLKSDTNVKSRQHEYKRPRSRNGAHLSATK